MSSAFPQILNDFSTEHLKRTVTAFKRKERQGHARENNAEED